MKDDDQNPYAPPRPVFDERRPARAGRERSANEGVNAWFEDGKIILPRFGGVLPDRCVVCNRPTDFKLPRTLQWHAPGYYFLICAGWIVYLIALFIVRKNAIVHVGLCDEHEARRKNGLTILWGGVVVGVILTFIGASGDTPILLLMGVVGLIGAVLVGGTKSRVVTVQKIDEGHVYLTAGDEFMRSLPTSPDDYEPPAPPRKKRRKKRVKRPAEDSAPKEAADEDDAES